MYSGTTYLSKPGPGHTPRKTSYDVCYTTCYISRRDAEFAKIFFDRITGFTGFFLQPSNSSCCYPVISSKFFLCVLCDSARDLLQLLARNSLPLSLASAQTLSAHLARTVGLTFHSALQTQARKITQGENKTLVVQPGRVRLNPHTTSQTGTLIPLTHNTSTGSVETTIELQPTTLKTAHPKLHIPNNASRFQTVFAHLKTRQPMMCITACDFLQVKNPSKTRFFLTG